MFKSKRYIIGISSSILMLICSCVASKNNSGGELVGAKLATWNEPSPYGMVKIPRGSINLGTDEVDTLLGSIPQSRTISVDAFWMDKTEISNSQYRQFVYYVRDSITRQRLADPAYGGDEEYLITEDKFGEPIKPQINWKKAIPSEKKATEEELKAINSLYKTNPITGKKDLDPSQLLYKYEVYNYHDAALYSKYLEKDPSRNVNWEDPKYEKEFIISKDTAYIDNSGRVVRETINRPLSSVYDFLNTYIVAIYPDNNVWVRDFPNSKNEIYTKMYFNHPAYDDYPVVGVTWEQAMAFSAWRTELFKTNVKIPEGQMIEDFRLPTQAEWEYAARMGDSNTAYPWSSESLKSNNDCFLANYKVSNGNYTSDKHLITSRVGTFEPNNFGLFDMAGNVSEWTSTAYTGSLLKQVNDINPQLFYQASMNDPHRKTLKVVMGGSWKDISRYIQSNQRTSEYQNVPRSYIGFRCVRSAIDFVK